MSNPTTSQNEPDPVAGGADLPYARVGPQIPTLPTPTALPNLIALMVLCIAPMIALSQVIAYWRTDVVDDQMFGFFGWRIAHGAVVYRDVWDNKPPGIYWINALGMLVGRDSYFGVMALCVVALVVAHVCFFATAASVYFRGAAAFTTILLSFFLTHAYYTGGTNRTETFLVPCELGAVLLYVRGFARDRWWKWYLAGVLCGLAFLFKQVGLAACAAMGLHTIILTCTRDISVKAAAQRCVLILAGVCSTVGAAAYVLAYQGVLHEAWFAAFAFNRAYFATGTSQFPYSYVSWVLLEDHLRILQLPLLMLAAACIHAVLWALRPRKRPPEIEQPLREIGAVCPHYMLLFGIWYVLSCWGALLSPHAFRHYLVPTIPPLLFLAGYLINVLQAETRLLVRMEQRIWVTAAFVAIAYFAFYPVRRQWEEVSTVWVYRFIQHEKVPWEVLGDIVADITRPDDRIQCWGYYPGVYLRARRINADRFVTTEKAGQVPGQADFVLLELDRNLRRDPPAVFVLSAGDYDWLHNWHPDNLPSTVVLGPWIDENYERVADVPYSINAYVFKRKDLVQPSDKEVLDRLSRRWEQEAR